MRVGKKATVVEAKKTRSCVVRLEKVPSPPAKSSRSSINARSSSQSHSDEKKFKGPLKKRPITQNTSSSSPATTSSFAPTTPVAKIKEKDKMKAPKSNKTTPIQTPVIRESPPPTIAAGRTRRAIKPNPKYASDDMVTSKIIKNVATLGVASNKKAGPKLRRRSTSSSEDFFNKESSDESDDDLDAVVNKSFIIENKQTDSDFSGDAKPIETPVRKRGRPKKIVGATPSSTPTPISKSGITASNIKGSSSQLQLLRKSFAASVRSMESLVGVKRKHESTAGSSSDNDLETGSTRKRFVLTKSANVREYKNLNSSDSQLTVRKGSQTLNGSKIMNTTTLSQTATPARNLLEKRKAMEGINRSVGGVSKIIGKPLAARLPQSLSAKPSFVRTMATTKQRSSSPATTPKAQKPSDKDVKDDENEKKMGNPPNSATDDFETMPTFTIVNINDIINKKGDVLISKSSKSQKSENAKHERDSLDSGAKSNDGKPGRRKMALLEKADTDRTKSPAPTVKKTTQKILNHSLGKRSSLLNAGSKLNTSSSSDKPAPRILNSMVAKKTLPVKPLIANLEDSADDESYPLSMDEEDDAATAEEEEDLFTIGKRKIPTSAPFMSSKKSVPATKENSLAATNRLPLKPNQRKLSPEKVVISRQGDKIIKKITCFEMWYVISIPEDHPPKLLRNQLEIPLIKLANLSTEIQLPTDSWMSKVTLHELSPSMLAKSNFETYTGDLTQYNIAEQDRGRYQPSCVMFRRSVNDRSKSRLPYDRAVIFKNKTFFTNIEGKNVKLVGAPSTINTEEEVEILLQIVDSLTLQSSLVEPTTTVQ